MKKNNANLQQCNKDYDNHTKITKYVLINNDAVIEILRLYLSETKKDLSKNSKIYVLYVSTTKSHLLEKKVTKLLSLITILLFLFFNHIGRNPTQ